MIREIIVICLLFAVTHAQITGKCRSCKDNVSPVCGEDSATYISYCVLMQQECLQEKRIGFACKGKCPCDPIEVENLDKQTVHKLQELRAQFQLEEEEKKVLKETTVQDNLMLEILDKKDFKDGIDKKEQQFIKENNAKYVHLNSEKHYKKGSGKCPTGKMSQLPIRLIDWFHVLKTNKQKEEMKIQGIEKEPVFKEMSFMDSKIKSMYSDLACTPQEDDEIEKQVCLSPVKWMFEHLDTDKDSTLDAVELYEIEEINNEHCIKPFLRDCDMNKDGKVVLKEFCQCLCIAPPCTWAIKQVPTILLRGKPMPVSGFFTPKCDSDGFFMPMQCNNRRKECWCVDRNGAEYPNTRMRGIPNCDDITDKGVRNVKLISLDMEKENKPRAS